MADKSGIEWTDATWNPVAGCHPVSEGCRHCYAAGMTRRLEAMGQKDYAGLVNELHFNGRLRLLEHRLRAPLHWRRPRRIFVNSMSDLFHADVPTEFLDQVWAVMAMCPQHTFQVLTKRPEIAARYFTAAPLMRIARWAYFSMHTFGRIDDGQLPPLALPNVWIGATVENQAAVDKRIQDLVKIPAAVRFLSCEPLLGPVELPIGDKVKERERFECGEAGAGMGMDGQAIHWIIAGGESGTKARPMNPLWVRGIRDQCAGAGIPFFFKQWGEWYPYLDQHGVHTRTSTKPPTYDLADGREIKGNFEHFSAPGYEMVRFGRRLAGCLLDGREWKEFPR